MAGAVLDDIATRFMAFSDALESSFADISIDFSLPGGISSSSSKHGGKAAGGSGQAAAKVPHADAQAALAERAAARKRGEDILAQLPDGYFTASFDALKHELLQMAPDQRQDDIDAQGDKLTAAVEVVGMRLAQHVLRNQDKLIAGITNVTLVEDDVRAAHTICRGTRAQLRLASDDVQRQVTIITSTRRKQHCLQVAEVLARVQQVQALPAALRRAHEDGDFAEGILLCAEGFRTVDGLKHLEVAPVLQLTVQRAYYDSMQHMQAALESVCGQFDGDTYSRLLEAYLLQGVPGEALADKVLSCFRGLLADVATRLVRSIVLAQLAFTQEADDQQQSGRGASNGGGGRDSSCTGVLEEGSFAGLCRRMTPNTLWPCVSKLAEAAFDLLASYDAMQQWQAAGIAQHAQAAAAAAAAAHAAAQASPAQQPQDSSSGADAGGHAAAATVAAASQQQLDHVQAVTKSMLCAMHAALEGSRATLVEAASVQLKDLLVGAAGCSGADFPRVVEACLHFAALCEAFTGGPLPMRAGHLHVLGALVRSSHKANMQTLKLALAAEARAPVCGREGSSSSSSIHSSASAAALPAGAGGISAALAHRHVELAAHCEPGFPPNWAAAASAGNPFRVAIGRDGGNGRAAGGQATVPDAASGQLVMAATGSSSSSSAAVAGAGQAPGKPPSRPHVPAHSSQLVLHWLAEYAGLMPLLPGARAALWGGMSELFDNYLLACFILFGGISLEELVRHEGCLPTRLRNALLRITTTPGCKYKEEVDELLRTQPSPAASEQGSRGSSPMPRAAGGAGKALDAFTRRFKNTVVELINTDLSQPLAPESPASTSSPLMLTPRQQPATPTLQQAQRAQDSPQQQPGAPQDDGYAASEQGTAGGGVEASGQPEVALLRQRVAAMEALSAIADALRASKAGLTEALGPAGLSKELEAFFGRTLDAAADLRDATYASCAKQLMPALADAECGVSAQVASCNYALREPATRHQAWVEVACRQLQGFRAALEASALPPGVQAKMWDAGARLCAEALLDGISSVRRCTQEGRAALSLDLSAVEKRLRALAPPAGAPPSLRVVDTYIKAFYVPWGELGRWAQTNLAAYGPERVRALVEVIADAYGVRSGAKAALLAQLAEFC